MTLNVGILSVKFNKKLPSDTLKNRVPIIDAKIILHTQKMETSLAKRFNETGSHCKIKELIEKQ